MKDKIILILTVVVTFLLNTVCFSFFHDWWLWGDFNFIIFVVGLLYTPVIVLSLFGVALSGAKRLCGKQGIALAWFSVWLAAVELVVQYVGFYICGVKFGWLITELWGIYYDLVALEALLIIGIILLVSLVVLYVLCRKEGRLHPAVNPSLRFVSAVGLVVMAAYGVAFCLQMFCISLSAQDITDWFVGKVLAALVLFGLLPAAIIMVSLVANRLNRKIKFLSEGFAQVALFIANLLYLRFFYYSWNDIIWDESYVSDLQFPAAWYFMLSVDLIWAVIILIHFIIHIMKNRKTV